jgi:hypothetical protein
MRNIYLLLNTMEFCSKCGKEVTGYIEKLPVNGTIGRRHPEYKERKLCSACRKELYYEAKNPTQTENQTATTPQVIIK